MKRRSPPGSRVVLLLLPLLLLLSGCTAQSTSLEERAMVRLVYLERQAAEYRALTVVCDFSAQGSSSGDAAAAVQTATAPTPELALQRAAAQRGGKPFFAQNQLVLLGPQLAETEFEEILEFFAQNCGTYRDPALWLWYGGETALTELAAPMDLVQRLETLTREDPLGCVCYVLECGDSATVLPVLEMDGAPDAIHPSVGGLAVVGEGLALYRDEAALQGYGLLRGRQAERQLAVECDGALYTVRLKALHREFSAPEGRLQLTLDGSGLAVSSTGEALPAGLAAAVNAALESQCQSALTLLTQNGQRDIFALEWWARQLGAAAGTAQPPEIRATIRLA